MTEEVVTFEKHTYGGDCLGRLSDGRAVFVPFIIPGETAKIRLVEEKKRFARGEIVEILEPSPERITPKCPHFFVPPTNGEKTVSCGGCHHQHISYEYQLRFKADVLRDQLERIGKLEDPPVQATAPSAQPWNYRNHLQFHITPDGQLGFQAPRAQAITAIKECHLPEAAIDHLWPQLDIESIPGLDRVGIRRGANDDLMVVLESSDPQPVGLDVDMPLSMVHLGPGGSIVMAGDDHIVIEVAERIFRVSAASFFNANTAMADMMVAHLLDNLSLTKNITLIDAYCGVGLFSAFLAPHVDRLIGIEASPNASEDFAINLDEFEHVEIYEAPVEDVLPALDIRPNVIVVDPPRSGLIREALDGILSLAPQTLVYISGDPATLARDAKRLTNGGYQLQQVTPFDLFPQTYHINSISFWEKVE
ncbi:MAG: class I SAM-dependent RNA methyltransferase [Anaerolineales bacterium]|nr:class I SAM-dependent RNA methyltransferase [Chloroflexota bacterium]MBL6980662.1 class I SAM-dependent RNA methyltransferase [Anaerolineales bacterium]